MSRQPDRAAGALIRSAFAVTAMLCAGQTWANAPSVAVVMPTGGAATQPLRLSGTLSAERQVNLSPRMDGLVSKVHVDAGDVVRAGQALLELDATLERLALERLTAEVAAASANLDEARRLVEEAQRLIDEQHLPRTQLGSREAALVQAQAVHEAARAAQREQQERVRRHTLPAPFDGVVTRKLTENGAWVTRSTPVFDLVATDSIRLDVQAPQERYAQLSADADVTVFPDAFPDARLPARIAARVPVSDAATRTFLVRVVVDEPKDLLLPGTSATAVFELPLSGEGRLRIPRDALLMHADGSHSVFVVDRSGSEPVARRRKITLGAASGDGVEVAGLRANEAVVVRGNEILREGQAVNVIDAGN